METIVKGHMIHTGSALHKRFPWECTQQDILFTLVISEILLQVYATGGLHEEITGKPSSSPKRGARNIYSKHVSKRGMKSDASIH